ncbi:ABC transporter ATP-binding protein [Amycolatopsis sp. CA-230715]|uniref:ABC transporter ATP-binding protein n=1 Tax=Amycolatopsis sp. CA-230715 TaxID=2745196 RepID=UPI001C019AB1|nr:ABC transporter ATP-binding protein [Amycolatopsis sp. CA-230715]QWF80929.1 putative ABC transporter ATP-binding protein YknY [Amycolatopsis sp. CA-230715]
MSEAVRLESVCRSYGDVVALDDVTIGFADGTFTAVMGPSGSGKSTLLHCAAGLDQPTSGRVRIDGVELTGASETAVTKFRRQRIGFVFQQFNLMPALTALQNVALPARLAGRRVDRARCVAALERVGLADQLDRRPAELSGGQQQRVAIARAVAAEPRAVFADEPTGALDTHNARQVLELLKRLGQTVIMVTHDPVAASFADSVVFLRDGRIVDRVAEPTANGVATRMASLATGA